MGSWLHATHVINEELEMQEMEEGEQGCSFSFGHKASRDHTAILVSTADHSHTGVHC